MTAALDPVGRARLRSEVVLAGKAVAPAWPLTSFIAVNPLSGLEDRPFEEAVDRAAGWFGSKGYLPEARYRDFLAAGRIGESDLRAALRRRLPDLELDNDVAADGALTVADVLVADLLHGEPAAAPERAARTPGERCDHALGTAVVAAVNAQLAKWCAAFCDEGQAGWRMPGREDGFWDAWRRLAPLDRALPAAARATLAQLPARAEDALAEQLERCGVAPEEQREVLRAHLCAQPGWASHVRLRGEQRGDIDLLSLLAARAAYERVLVEAALAGRDFASLAPEPLLVAASAPAAAPAPAVRLAAALAVLGQKAAELTDDGRAAALAALAELPAARRPAVWLDAYEAAYRDRLLQALDRTDAAAGPAPEAQAVFCIDVRSEGLRRRLEARGAYETLGFAGFFAVAIRFQELAGGAPTGLCPVLLAPRNPVREVAAPGHEHEAEAHVRGRRAATGAEGGFHAMKDDPVAHFMLAEASGFVAGPLAAGKTLAAGAYGRARGRLARLVVPPAATELTVDEGFTLDERVLFARAALTMMGLVEGFAPLVLLCAHGSRTENNPYQAALDCGACGGHRGAPNARTAARILNQAEVRESLLQSGIAIPQGTLFVAGEHDTASDTVTLLDEHLVPMSHREGFDRLRADLAAAGAELAAERCLRLPGAAATAARRGAARLHVRARGTDWAQVYPEWGLAGNAAFVVGPRSLTRGLDLGCRTFLHSYDAALDPEGGALETILTAPLVVAQWINCQYYFSTVDPDVFGAGTKTIHNVVAGVGVLAGQSGDLQLGLPWQSVAVGERLVHEPMRLLAVVEAPLDRIDEIIARNTVLRNLFGNGWVALAAREAAGEPWQRRCRDATWETWQRQPEVVTA